jgi:arabinan endo-1,5-alpha-L-arabinosidase
VVLVAACADESARPPGDGGAGQLDASDGTTQDVDGGDSARPDAAVQADAGGTADGTARDGPPAEAGGGVDSSASDGPTWDAGVASCGDSFAGGPINTTTTHLDIGVHDPSMIWDGTNYYLFATGGTLGIRSSPDILTYNAAGTVFASVPSWITATIGSTPSSLWAPDISYFAGQFHVYYAGSSFGSNNSVIGLATNGTLQPEDPKYQWVDQGLVIHSTSSDNWNAIDPSVTFDPGCNPWLVFGSFWSGIKLRKLDATSGMPATDDTTLYSLASRNGGAIEGPSIISHNGYFYLFVSFDACCQGVNSTYRTMVGRATSIAGPYVDKSGTNMMQGAAEQLLASSGRYIGPGGGTAWRDGNTYLYAYHYYDGQDSGNPKLQIRPIEFDSNDWIVMGAPLFP